MQKEHLSGQGKPWPDLLTRKKERGITKPHIKICDAVDKEEPMGQKGMTSVDSRLVWPCKPLCALGGRWWHPHTLKPFLKRRGRFVREVLLPLKNPSEP